MRRHLSLVLLGVPAIATFPSTPAFHTGDWPFHITFPVPSLGPGSPVQHVDGEHVMEKRQILDFTPPSQFAVVKLTDRRTVGDPKPSPTPTSNLASPSPPHTSNLASPFPPHTSNLASPFSPHTSNPASPFPPHTSFQSKPLLPNIKNPVWGNGKWEEQGKGQVNGFKNHKHKSHEQHGVAWASEEQAGVWDVEEGGKAWGAGDGWEEEGGNQVWEEEKEQAAVNNIWEKDVVGEVGEGGARWVRAWDPRYSSDSSHGGPETPPHGSNNPSHHTSQPGWQWEEGVEEGRYTGSSGYTDNSRQRNTNTVSNIYAEEPGYTDSNWLSNGNEINGYTEDNKFTNGNEINGYTEGNTHTDNSNYRNRNKYTKRNKYTQNMGYPESNGYIDNNVYKDSSGNPYGNGDDHKSLNGWSDGWSADDVSSWSEAPLSNGHTSSKRHNHGSWSGWGAGDISSWNAAPHSWESTTIGSTHSQSGNAVFTGRRKRRPKHTNMKVRTTKQPRFSIKSQFQKTQTRFPKYKPRFPRNKVKKPRLPKIKLVKSPMISGFKNLRNWTHRQKLKQRNYGFTFRAF